MPANGGGDGAAGTRPSAAATFDLSVAETLAAHLLTHAAAVRDHHAQLEAAIVAEETAAAKARGETEALQAELEQYHGWISGEREGGSAYRMSKALHDEQERRASVEAEVAALHGKLGTMSERLQALVQMSRDSPQAQQARAADEALSHLALLRQVYRSSTEPSSAPA